MRDPYRSAPPASSWTRKGGWACPRCTAGLGGEEVAGVRLDRCIRCEGAFVTVERMNELIERRDMLDELRAMLPRTPRRMGEPGPMYVRCPVCATLMNRKQYATGAKVVIDVCRQHGVWFDGGELVVVLDFIASGGLEAARRRDQERRDEERREAKLRAAFLRARHPTSTREVERDLAWWWLD
ncbi:MAG TPA: zf-TFIIB domain-containing protein [Kofleriaceae bacterium]|nr:zf-TFIIB domain-containing protein [Kofleriaceae bacterium]